MKIHPVALRDIAVLFAGSVTYQTLRSYNRDRILPPPAGFVNDSSVEGRVAVWDRDEIVAWGTSRGWEVVA